MENYLFFKSVLEQDTSAVVLCDTEHKIVYMNPAAIDRYARFGGKMLMDQSLLDCHNARSAEKIKQVLGWFAADQAHNRVHTFYNEEENKDVYMIALRDEVGRLIGYYEKHEYRSRDMAPLYAL